MAEETPKVEQPKTWKETLKPFAAQLVSLAMAALTAYLVSKGYLPGQ